MTTTTEIFRTYICRVCNREISYSARSGRNRPTVCRDCPQPLKDPGMSLAWQTRALCSQVGGDIWFPDSTATPAAAKTICATCPVAAKCLDYALALGDVYGVWGGTTRVERQKMRRRS